MLATKHIRKQTFALQTDQNFGLHIQAFVEISGNSEDKILNPGKWLFSLLLQSVKHHPHLLDDITI